MKYFWGMCAFASIMTNSLIGAEISTWKDLVDQENTGREAIVHDERGDIKIVHEAATKFAKISPLVKNSKKLPRDVVDAFYPKDFQVKPLLFKQIVEMAASINPRDVRLQQALALGKEFANDEQSNLHYMNIVRKLYCMTDDTCIDVVQNARKLFKVTTDAIADAHSHAELISAFGNVPSPESRAQLAAAIIAAFPAWPEHVYAGTLVLLNGIRDVDVALKLVKDASDLTQGLTKENILLFALIRILKHDDDLLYKRVIMESKRIKERLTREKAPAPVILREIINQIWAYIENSDEAITRQKEVVQP